MHDSEQDALVEALYNWGRALWIRGGALTKYRVSLQPDEVREFIAQHRLVSLPEEKGWKYEIRDLYSGGSLRWMTAASRADAEMWATLDATTKEASTGRIRPIYHIPGDPIDVSGEQP